VEAATKRSELGDRSRFCAACNLASHNTGERRDGNVPNAEQFRGWYQDAFIMTKNRFEKSTKKHG
jgi:hypothetical protein